MCLQKHEQTHNTQLGIYILAGHHRLEECMSDRVDEPIIMQRLTAEDIDQILHTPECFTVFPRNSQSVERAVKLVSTASNKVCGEEWRHSYI